MKYIKLSERLHIPHYVKELKLGEIVVNPEVCVGCGWCVRICPGSALEVHAKKVRMVAFELPQCMACGDCMAICPEGAIIDIVATEYSGYYKTLNRAGMSPPRRFTPEERE